MTTTADRLAEQISDYFHKCDTLQPLGWHMARGLSSALAASLAQQQATQEAQAECTCATKDMPFGRCCKAPRIVAWLCQYRSGEEFASLARNPLNDPDVCSATPLYATQPPSPCTAKELSEAEITPLQFAGRTIHTIEAPGAVDAEALSRGVLRFVGIPGARQQATPTPPQEPSQPEAGEV